MNKDKRVVLLLAAYDYESLHLTLESLSHTIDEDEKVVIVLNGRRGIRSSLVEDVARTWSAKGKNRHVVKPLNYGLDAYTSISEVIEKFSIIKNAEFICKIDDDLIPLRKNWVDRLHQAYIDLEKKHNEIGFVTSLINNNSWGFKRLIDIYEKQNEYEDIMNFESHSSTGIVAAAKIGESGMGTVWHYPYLAKWIHNWTLCAIEDYLQKTSKLGIEEVGLDIHYSIGCIFFRKELWGSLKELEDTSNFDELLIHKYCQKFELRKFAVMNEPMGHLFYHVQRIPNRLILPKIKESLAKYWYDDSFLQNAELDDTTKMEIVLEGHSVENSDRLKTIQYDLEVIRKSSFYYKLRSLYRFLRSTLLRPWGRKSEKNRPGNIDARVPRVNKVIIKKELVK